MRTAIRDTLGSPSAWAVAAAGFMVRGGILVLAVPVLSLPTPVGVTLLVPPLSVTTSGISSVYVPQLLALGAAALVVVAVALVLGALSDAVSFRMMADRSAAARDRPGTSRAPAAGADATPGVRPVPVRGGVHPGLLARLVATELFALLPAVAAGLVTVSRLISVGEQEFLLPTSVDVPYPVRVVQGAAEPVIALAVCLLLADVANALLSRRVLRRDERRRRPETGAPPAFAAAAAGLDASLPMARADEGPAAFRRLRRDLLALGRIGATWAGAWIVTLASIVPGVIAIELAWPGVRDAYTATMSRTPPSAGALVVATVVFVATWLAALLVAGLGSAIRTTLWSFATAP